MSQSEIAFVITVIEKGGLAPDAALRNVVRKPWHYQSSSSCHVNHPNWRLDR